MKVRQFMMKWILIIHNMANYFPLALFLWSQTSYSLQIFSAAFPLSWRWHGDSSHKFKWKRIIFQNEYLSHVNKNEPWLLVMLGVMSVPLVISQVLLLVNKKHKTQIQCMNKYPTWYRYSKTIHKCNTYNPTITRLMRT